jgi:hypothetical protein
MFCCEVRTAMQIVSLAGVLNHLLTSSYVLGLSVRPLQPLAFVYFIPYTRFPKDLKA